MCHARPEVITFVIDEDLRFVFQLAEGGRMQNPVPVALKRRSGDKLACMVRSCFLGMKPPARMRTMAGIGCQLTAFGDI